MKRYLCLLFALLLPVFALAEDSPAHVTEQLRSNSGGTVINIDADVIVPEAQAIPRYQVRLRELTEEEVVVMADAIFGDEAYTGSAEYEDVISTANGKRFARRIDLKAAEQVETDYEPGVTQPLHWLAVATFFRPDANTPQNVFAQYDQAQVAGEGSYHGAMEAMEAVPKGELTGTVLSQEEARAMADKAVAAFAPWMTRAAEGTMWAVTLTHDLYGEYAYHKQGWAFAYTRELPLPMTYESTNPGNGPLNPDLSYIPTICREFIRLVVDDGGIQGLRYEQPLEITQVLDENCELLPFESIMNVARVIFPLHYAYNERFYPDIRMNVDRITLGYMVTFSRNNAEFCEIIPVWDFFGTAEMRTQEGDVLVEWTDPFQSLLTVNAMDGTIIDRAYGY